ncbi:MAG: hypothetical protein AAGK22_17890 [Acidobacteriota bacterium]
MKKLFILFAAALLASAGFALMADDTWTGEVLDMKCYANGQKGEGHAGCAKRCLEGGSDMGLLVGDDVVKVDMEASDEGAIKTMIENGGKNVEITGTASTADGETTVVVKTAKAA